MTRAACALRVAHGGLGVVLLAALGCDPTAFDVFEEQAPILVIEAPDNYEIGGFGARVSGYGGLLEGTVGMQSRVAVTAGPDSAVGMFQVWSGAALGDGRATNRGCRRSDKCDAGHGEQVVGVGTWRPGTSLCVITTAPEAGTYREGCEGAQGMPSLPHMPGIGSAATELPVELGLARLALGSPREQGGAGAVYLVGPGGGLRALEAPQTFELPSRQGLGVALASAYDGSASPPRTLVAAAASGRIFLVALGEPDPATPDQPTRSLLGCIDGESGGFGRVLAMAHFGAGAAVGGAAGVVLAVGAGPESPGRANTVRLYAASELADQEGCDGAAVAPIKELECPMNDRGVDCTNAAFGGAITFGLVDGDDVPDLIVGAPLAPVEGVAEAGAVFVYAGKTLAGEVPVVDALTLSTQERGARLGFSVSTVPTAWSAGVPTRHEPVAGAPGADRVAVFLCSGLEGDTPAVGPRCIPAP